MFKKLNTRKKWLTLNKAIEYLAFAFEEEVSISDIYQLALEGQLALSVRFSSTTFMKNCIKTKLTQANFNIFHTDTIKESFYKKEQNDIFNHLDYPILRPKDLSDSELVELRETISIHQKNMTDSIQIEYEITSQSKRESFLGNDGSIYSLLDRTYPIGRVIISAIGMYLPQEEVYIEVDEINSDVTREEGHIWDILPSSHSQRYIERLYQKAENNHSPDSESLDPYFYLVHPVTAKIVVLYDYVGGNLEPSLGLSRDAEIIIRTDELTALITGESSNNSISQRKEVTYLRYIALLAKAYASKAGSRYGNSEAPNKSKIYEELERLMPEEGIHGISSTTFSDHVKAGLEHLE